MKREIKFRAWSKMSNRMIYPEGAWANRGRFFRVLDVEKEVEFMQYTGLKDKYGMEIYEGDIIAIYYTENKVDTKDIYMKDVVVFGKHNIGCNGYEYDFEIHGFYVKDEFLYGYLLNEKSTVIGNIYENKELL